MSLTSVVHRLVRFDLVMVDECRGESDGNVRLSLLIGTDQSI